MKITKQSQGMDEGAKPSSDSDVRRNILEYVISEIIRKKIDTIKKIADCYMRLKSLLPNYKNEYLEAYEYLTNRFDNIGSYIKKAGV